MRILIGGGLLYLGLSVFCAFGAAHLPEGAQHILKPLFWLLGPPANLVHGANFLLPFLAGTAIVGGLAVGAYKSKSPSTRSACRMGLIITWVLSGCLVYAPGT